MNERPNQEHPLPFRQPYLRLRVVGPEGKTEDWTVDVGGKIEMLIENQAPTKLLQEIFDSLARSGHNVTRFGPTSGSCGPNHVFRGGAFFRHMNKLDVGDRPNRPQFTADRSVPA